jgi:hypothetical protein
MWAQEGIMLCLEDSPQAEPNAIPDGKGGAFVIWVDYRNDMGTFSNGDLYMQHIDRNGALLWDPSGVPICDLAGNQQQVVGVSDGKNGVIVAWWDKRDVYADIYAQHIDWDGNSLWEPNGKPVCLAPGVQRDVRIVTDNCGGALVFWKDYREDYDFEMSEHIYAQRLTGEGKVMGRRDGVAIAIESGARVNPAAVTDVQGNGFLVWSDERNNDYDIYSERVEW